MTATIKQIGSVVLESPLYINEFDEPNDQMGEVEMSSLGSHIVFTAPINTPYRTAGSRGQSGWLSEQNVIDLKAMWNAPEVTFQITYDDDSTESCRMAVEKQISFDEISLGTCIYTGTIPMAKVTL